MYFLNCAANKDMFKLNSKYSISWLICLLRCIKIKLNWIELELKENELNWNWIERFWIQFELELNWIEKSRIQLELNWKKWIDPSPDRQIGIAELFSLYVPFFPYCPNFMYLSKWKRPKRMISCAFLPLSPQARTGPGGWEDGFTLFEVLWNCLNP